MAKRKNSEPESDFEQSSILKECRFEEETVDQEFNNRVIRRFRVEKKAKSLNAIFPLLVGATTAAVGVIALLQAITQPVSTPGMRIENQEASLEQQPELIMPELTE